MDLNAHSQLRRFVTQRLKMHGDYVPLEDGDLLFTSGRLDSLDAVELIVTLETDFGIEFAKIGFDLMLLDSLGEIAGLVNRHGKIEMNA